MNLPIYRAKKIDSNEWVEGYLVENYIFLNIGNTIGIDRNDLKFYKIDSLTLAIHFPDMLDSEGNKIFASLQDDGKGGDIIQDFTFDDGEVLSAVCKFTPSGAYLDGDMQEYLSEYQKHMNLSKYTHKVIGIQE